MPHKNQLLTICLIAISSDFFESVLPKPELSGDVDFPDKLLGEECLSTCFGGTELLLACNVAPLGRRPLEGEHDCRLGLALGRRWTTWCSRPTSYG
ncbi:hypothetical protein V6N13_075435 [Hibiscus sabdariffa]